jgi:site-specific recombinase XerD
MLRHTIATELAMDHKMPLYLLMKLLRHKHLGTTQQYLHVRPEWTEEAREYMDRVS